MNSIPALVSLTATQIPIIGPERRFITRLEALRLQGFPENHKLPTEREAAFEALGNAVHVDMVTLLAGRLFGAASEAKKNLSGQPSASQEQPFRLSSTPNGVPGQEQPAVGVG
jgi:DNA (cytosine-5)-methyltransferase 1